MTISAEEREAICKAIARLVREEIERALRPVHAEIMQLGFKIDNAELKARELRYCGTWNERSTYALGNLTTHDGSVWHSNLPDNRAKPGSDPVAWTLAVKRGQDRKGLGP
jgi:hypothetical protein